MKVLEIQDCFYPSVDGPIEVMNSLAFKFAENNLGEVELLVPKYPQKVEVEGLKVHRCKSLGTRGGYRASLPQIDRSVKKLIKKGGFDIIHLHSPFTLGRYAVKLGKRYNIPVVITVHTKFRDEFETVVKSKPIQKFLLRYIMKCIDACDGITTVSYGMKAVLEEYGSKRADDIRVIYNATNMPASATDPDKVRALREKHGLEGKFTFMFAGRLAEVKNVQFSLEVLKSVKEKGFDNFKFLIVGDGAYGKTLKKLVEKYNLSENVEFVGKITDKGVLAEYYAASDLMLFPSLFDSFGLVVVEAAANSLPCAVIKGTCASERTEDGISGFVWDYDKNVWTENIISLMQNPASVKTASEGARQKVYVDWNSIAKEYCALYKELIDGKKAKK